MEGLREKMTGRWPVTRPYLLAVSGGIDSMVMWHLLRMAGYSDLVVVHVDHGLRDEESKADASFVESEAERLTTPCVIRRVDAAAHAKERKRSLETAARELRYAAFAEVARERDCPRVFLAHHADDRIETALMHLFRGTGSRGLAGMAEECQRTVDGAALTLLRPLLGLSRVEIETYAAFHDIAWREDSSNSSDFALRNRIRHRLLPEIAKVFGRDVSKAILRAADLAALDEAWVAGMLGELPRRGDSDGLDVSTLRAFPEAKRNRLLLSWLRGLEVPDCGRAEVERTSAVLLSDGSPAKASLPGGFHVRRRAGLLFIEPRPGSA